MSTITNIRHYSTRNLNQRNWQARCLRSTQKPHGKYTKRKRKIKWKILGPIKQKKDITKENLKEDVCQEKKGTR